MKQLLPTSGSNLTTPPASETPRSSASWLRERAQAFNLAVYKTKLLECADEIDRLADRLREAEAHYTGANRDFKAAQEVIDCERHRAEAAELGIRAEPCGLCGGSGTITVVEMSKDTGGHEIRRHTKQCPQCSAEAAERPPAPSVGRDEHG